MIQKVEFYLAKTLVRQRRQYEQTLIRQISQFYSDILVFRQVQADLTVWKLSLQAVTFNYNFTN